jgi:hypothetical protein
MASQLLRLTVSLWDRHVGRAGGQLGGSRLVSTEPCMQAQSQQP